eukprot:scaffold1154_cov310-Pinguiococcus_pyrenoidosus.AAC.38
MPTLHKVALVAIVACFLVQYDSRKKAGEEYKEEKVIGKQTIVALAMRRARLSSPAKKNKVK